MRAKLKYWLKIKIHRYTFLMADLLIKLLVYNITITPNFAKLSNKMLLPQLGDQKIRTIIQRYKLRAIYTKNIL